MMRAELVVSITRVHCSDWAPAILVSYLRIHALVLNIYTVSIKMSFALIILPTNIITKYHRPISSPNITTEYYHRIHLQNSHNFQSFLLFFYI